MRRTKQRPRCSRQTHSLFLRNEATLLKRINAAVAAATAEVLAVATMGGDTSSVKQHVIAAAVRASARLRDAVALAIVEGRAHARRLARYTLSRELRIAETPVSDGAEDLGFAHSAAESLTAAFRSSMLSVALSYADAVDARNANQAGVASARI